MRKIANTLGVSIDAVTYVLRKTQVPRRSPQETNAITFANKPLSFHICKPRSKKEQEINLIGAMLYWAEGYKTQKAKGVDFANSDPEMVRLFMLFLRTRYRFDKERLRILLYCFSDQDQKQLLHFWSRLLQIPPSQFTKPYVRKKTTPSSRAMRYGLVHIRYSDKRMLKDLLNLIHSYVQSYP